MLSLARSCGTKIFTTRTKQLISSSPHSLIRSGCNRTAVENSLWCRHSLFRNTKVSNLMRGSGTATLKLASGTSSRGGKKAVGYWLLSCGGMVFVAVVLGGVTRLTESGLSMVTWKLLGEKVPRTVEDWKAEFIKYQQFPEFKIKNKDMTLTEFKTIWYMEYGHRMWGRAIGAVFLAPAVVFWMRGMFKRGMKMRVLVFGSLIIAQGLLGWYMVKSGLEDRFQSQNDVPRVSQYRLATHLSMAFILYTLFLWSALDHLLPASSLCVSSSKEILRAARKFRMLAHTCKGMVFLTAVSGAFVAGLDAGLVYNSFPKMADKWIPDDILAFTPKISNITENPTTVQFNHRILGTTTIALITGLWFLSRKRTLPPRAHLAATAFVVVGWVQVGLGITTLVMHVPTVLAASHQSGSLLLLSTALWLTHELKRLPKI